MSDVDLNGPITIIVTGIVSLLVEYFRRKMPPEKFDRRKEDRDSQNSPGYTYNDEEMEDDDV